MNKQFNLVKACHIALGSPVASHPTKLKRQRRLVRGKWIIDEVLELMVAETLHDQIDASMDIAVFALGNMVEMGVQPEKFFAAVVAGSMRKVWPDGSVRKDKNGKWIKPPGWFGPEKEIKELLKSVK
jgi:predicted HAD superfamily Cof-like phosphohydrolase